MKLYLYEHCPFCARVRYVAAMLNVSLQLVPIAYDDEQTTTEIIGIKQVPLLIKDNGEALAESEMIIDYLLRVANCQQSPQPSQQILDWQQKAFLPLQKLGYPRWAQMGLPEFQTQASQLAWRLKKETEQLNFERLVRDTAQIADEVQALIAEAKALLHISGFQKLSLVNEGVLFSILRGFASAPEVQWDKEVKQWLDAISTETHIALLTEESFHD
ncbi:glutaredoxin 2 [Ferrimonas aestuarii]|uniref:Glutaredoxin 2 n=1 Tax=Ferrimonas aestuarii TaxID=2569539 RepID=A0A4U1BFY0_9GAMM|nr:glutaredoxin 2 [Ferrimonas aestuarii]TKB50039.1 glutaredoxin 2 [Ferrimonas aestuarii]